MVVRAQPPSGGRSAHQIEAGAGAVTEPALANDWPQRFHGSCDRGNNGSTERGTCILLRSVSRHAPDGSLSSPAGTCFGIEPKASGAPRVHVFDAAPPRTYARCTARARHAMTATPTRRTASRARALR